MSDLIRVRPARTEDAARVVEMSASVSAAEGVGPPAVTAAMVRRLAFEERLLHVFVAEAERGLVGHVIATRSFDVQEGAVTYWLADLFVEAEFRGRRVGRRLVGAVAERAVAERAAYISWMVTPGNRSAEEFYASIRARRDGGVAMFLGREEMVNLTGAGAGR